MTQALAHVFAEWNLYDTAFAQHPTTDNIGF